MKVFIRNVWSNYEETTTLELQYKIDNCIGEYYIIDEITDDCIYVCRFEED